MRNFFCFFFLLAVGLASVPASSDNKIVAVAAENFYGEVLSQLGGDRLIVTSVIQQPTQDPHLFEASPATARRLAIAQLVVYNGAAYDPWIIPLLATTSVPHRTCIVAAELIGAQAGDNPHVWYLPTTMMKVAKAIHTFLIHQDPSNKQFYDARLSAFLAALQPINAKITMLRATYAGVPVTATEPVFGYMAHALGLKMRHISFQRAVLNRTEPRAADIAAFEDDLRQRRVKLLIYNQQTTDPMAHHMLVLAQRSGVTVVNVTETQPAGRSYPQWMLSQLNALESALDASTRSSIFDLSHYATQQAKP